MTLSSLLASIYQCQKGSRRVARVHVCGARARVCARGVVRRVAVTDEENGRGQEDEERTRVGGWWKRWMPTGRSWPCTRPSVWDPSPLSCQTELKLCSLANAHLIMQMRAVRRSMTGSAPWCWSQHPETSQRQLEREEADGSDKTHQSESK